MGEWDFILSAPTAADSVSCYRYRDQDTIRHQLELEGPGIVLHQKSVALTGLE